DLPSSTVARPPGAVSLKLFRKGDRGWSDLGFPADTPHGSRIAAVPRPLVDYLHGRGAPLATAEEGKVCIEMILGAYESAREGRRVGFEAAHPR
ncbi:MAG TPA: gfo/Idh/MocA family oxidoreductase, partial [Actinopolymorphaceae bacterium]